MVNFKKYSELVMHPKDRFADYIDSFRLRNLVIVWLVLLGLRLGLNVVAGILQTAGSQLTFDRYYGGSNPFGGTFASFMYGNTVASSFINAIIAVLVVAGAAYLAYLLIKSKANHATYKEVLKIYLLANLPVTVILAAMSVIALFSGFLSLISPILAAIPGLLICLLMIILVVAVVWFFVMFIQGLMSVYELESGTATLSGCLSVFVMVMVLMIISVIFGVISGATFAALNAGNLQSLNRIQRNY
jgi:hypothetical protein